MLRKFLLMSVIFVMSFSTWLYSDSLLIKELRKNHYPSLRFKDQRLTLKEKLQKWFPKHQIINVDKNYYLTTPYFRHKRSDFVIKNDVISRRSSVIPDTTCTFTDSTIVLNTTEIIPAFNLTQDDFRQIKNQLAWLTVLFRTLGTPIPELMLGNFDEVDTYVIINKGEVKERIIMPSFTETVKKLNNFYENKQVYFEFAEVKKINSRLEFFGSMFVRDSQANKTDFIEIRFHTNRLNEIDLVMFIIHKNV